jgi:cytochrome c oxidase cbb3-type subunit 3
LLACAALATISCEREARPFKDLRVASEPSTAPAQTRFAAGGALPPDPGANPFRRNAWGLSEGKRFFTLYNCSGCHAQGGGGIGPPLMDDEWIYGFEPDEIFRTIVEGRPNGMPSFRNRVPDYQVWQLVAYVQSMSGQTPIDAAPSRSDHMRAHRPELITPYQPPRQTGHK